MGKNTAIHPRLLGLSGWRDRITTLQTQATIEKILVLSRVNGCCMEVCMLTKLRAKNFKSWKDTGELELAPLTGLFGSNSSGKTSILQMLLMLKQTVESPDRRRVLHTGDERSLVELGTFKDILYNHTGESSMKFGFEWNLKENLKIEDPEQKGRVMFEDSKLEFQSDIGENGGGRLSVNKLMYRFASYSFVMKRKSKNEYTLDAE